MPIFLGHRTEPALGSAGALISTTNTTNSLTGAASATLPPATLKSGEVYRLWFAWQFIHTAAANPLLQFTLGILGVDTSFSITPIATAGTYNGDCEGFVTIVAPGASGTVRRALIVRGYGIQADNQWGGGMIQDVANVGPINQNVSGVLNLRANMVTAVAGNTLALSQGTCERVVGL